MANIEDLISYVSWNQPLNSSSEKMHWLEDGEIIEFTKRKPMRYNAEYEINGDTYRSIYFSQLECRAITKQYKAWGCMLILKDGTRKRICDYSENDFWQIACNKTFRVDIYSDVQLVINRKSKQLNGFCSYNKVLEKIKECVNNDRIQDIGDLLLKRRVYALTEQ